MRQAHMQQKKDSYGAGNDDCRSHVLLRAARRLPPLVRRPEIYAVLTARRKIFHTGRSTITAAPLTRKNLGRGLNHPAKDDVLRL